MLTLPRMNVQDTSRQVTDLFRGYNHNIKIRDGEFFEEKNLCSDYHPMLANRGKRGTVKTLTAPGGLLEKDALAYVDNGTLYYNDLETGLTGLSPGEKQMVSMGAYLCIFPDKVYFNTADFSDYGSMEASYVSQGDVSYALCRADGTVYEKVCTGITEPEVSVDVWIDTSGDTAVAMQWSASMENWVELPTVYTKISFSTQGQVGEAFAEYDGVEISGAQFDGVNGSKILYAVGGEADKTADYVVVAGLMENNFTQTEGSLSIRRELPQMDFVCECQNRLWGCYYGVQDGKTLNEIYCCALGDFKNWRQYMGLSTDSWTASVGSDGQWTGAINYLGYPTFFKENRVHRVSVSSSGAHQIDETVCRGVQKGSHRSLQVVNETLYYKSRTDVCAWQGGFPEGVSYALGNEKYDQAVAGSFGEKYYISMKNGSGKWNLFVYDIGRGIWHREDDLHALCFASVDDELYCIDAGSGALLALNGTRGQPEEMVQWEAVSGILYYEYPDKKYVSRYNFRIRMDQDARAEIYIQYDSDGIWRLSGTVRKGGTGTVTVPIRPRRCDHMQIKLSGEGEIRLFSIARILEVGSDK